MNEVMDPFQFSYPSTPTLDGETRFYECYDVEPSVNYGNSNYTDLMKVEKQNEKSSAEVFNVSKNILFSCYLKISLVIQVRDRWREVNWLFPLQMLLQLYLKCRILLK